MKTAETKAGIEAKDRVRMAAALNSLLADEFTLYVQARNFHWNVMGPNFGELHAFFEQQYEALDKAVDEVAERVLALGERALGTMADFQKEATIRERDHRLSAREMLQSFVAGNEAAARRLHEDIHLAAEIGDEGTIDLLGGLLRGHEKAAWMGRAYLG